MSLIFDPYENVDSSKLIVYRPPGMVYNLAMANYDCPWDKSYPEGPDRYMSVFNRLKELGLFEKLTQVPSRKATDQELGQCHTPEIISLLKETAGSTDLEGLELLSSKYDAIYLHPNSYEAALLAAGSTIELVAQICSNKIPSGFALVRPPGHHAMVDEFCGYCYFNNAALAAKHAMDNFGIKKVLIVDWDVHHGQATQQMFYDDKRVLYFSIHRYEHGTFWPNLRESDFDHIGAGKGVGFNFNVPLNKTGMNDADYMAIFHNLLMPVASEFQPELIIISAGFDAALGCPEGEMLVTPACYAHLLWSLKNLANGKVAVVLEGGYCLKSLAEGAALTVRALIGEPCPSIGPLGMPCAEMVESINDSMHSHRRFWGCFLQAMKSVKVRLDENTAENVHCPIVKFLHNDPKPTSYPTRDCYPVQSKEFLENVDSMLETLRKNTQLSFAPNKFCFIYDEHMMRHDPGRHVRSQHPEDPKRIAHIFEKFVEFEIVLRGKRLESRRIKDEELVLVHTPDYIKFVKDVSDSSPENQRDVGRDFNSVSFCKHSFDSACLASGCLVQVVDEVMSGESQSGLAIIRPPGHHAYPELALGFCFLNNVAVAARYAKSKYNLDRILILDWDVHHGNGTQEIFYEDPSVLYISLHVYADKKFFPNMECSSDSYVGVGEGEGFNVNIPWHKFGVGDSDYIAAFHSVVLPIAYQYDPQLVIVSAGFDAAINDCIGKCEVSPEAFGHFTHYVSALANGKVILALEGGYNKESVATSLVCCAKTMLGDPLPVLKTTCKPLKEVEVIKDVIQVQKKYWSCLQFTKTIADMADVLVPLAKDLVPAPLPVDDMVVECEAGDVKVEPACETETCAMEIGAEGDFKEEGGFTDGRDEGMEGADRLKCDILEFVEQYPGRDDLFSLENLEAVHAACLHEQDALPDDIDLDGHQFVEGYTDRRSLISKESLEPEACSRSEMIDSKGDGCEVQRFVERYPSGDQVFSLEALDAIHLACMNSPLPRACRADDIVRMAEESNDIGCTSANCDEICAWRCGNCFNEICSECKRTHAL